MASLWSDQAAGLRAAPTPCRSISLNGGRGGSGSTLDFNMSHMSHSHG